jgi:hypothetical protein
MMECREGCPFSISNSMSRKILRPPMLAGSTRVPWHLIRVAYRYWEESRRSSVMTKRTALRISGPGGSASNGSRRCVPKCAGELTFSLATPAIPRQVDARASQRRTISGTLLPGPQDRGRTVNEVTVKHYEFSFHLRGCWEHHRTTTRRGEARRASRGWGGP